MGEGRGMLTRVLCIIILDFNYSNIQNKELLFNQTLNI